MDAKAKVPVRLDRQIIKAPVMFDAEIVDGLNHTVAERLGDIADAEVMPCNSATRPDFVAADREFAKRGGVAMIGVNIYPVKIAIGKAGQYRLGEAPVYLSEACCEFSCKPRANQVEIQCIALTTPSVDKMKSPNITAAQDLGGKTSASNSDFGNDAAFRHRIQQRFARWEQSAGGGVARLQNRSQGVCFSLTDVTHEPAVADHISGEDGGKPALGKFFGHMLPLRLGAAA